MILRVARCAQRTIIVSKSGAFDDLEPISTQHFLRLKDNWVSPLKKNCEPCGRTLQNTLIITNEERSIEYRLHFEIFRGRICHEVCQSPNLFQEFDFFSYTCFSD